MQVEISYHEISEAAKTGFAEYLQGKLHRLAKPLLNVPAESLMLHAHAAFFRHHRAYEVTLRLTLPGAPECYSREVSHLLHKALDLTFDHLEAQVVRVIDRLKKAAR